MKSKSVSPMTGSSTPNEISAAAFKATRPDRKGRSWIRRSATADRTADGIRFDSKSEMTRYLELKAMKAAGRILGFVRQPVLDLAGAVYRPDFMTWQVSSITGETVHAFEEVKGRGSHPEVLRRFRRNQVQAERLYGIPVILVEIES